MLVNSSGYLKNVNDKNPYVAEGLPSEAARKPYLSTVKVTEAHAIEEEILKLSGLELYKEVHIFDVPIDYLGQNHIHTYSCGSENTETLVLVHGYGGCSLLFFPMLKELSKKYKVYCIDLLGMGLSSRPEFTCTTTEETVSFFVESIEAWRKAMDIQSFYLGGHSFGGYMSTHYTAKYQQYIKKLFLLSPVAVSRPQTEISVEEWLNSLSWIKRKMFKMILGLWESKQTIGEYYRKHCIIGPYLLKKYMSRQFGNNGKEEKLVEQLIKFFSALFKIEGGSDKAIYFIVKPPRARPILPVEDILKDQIKVPIRCFYGDNDWMDKTGPRRIEASGENDLTVKIITGSGHQITMHNPKMMAEELLSVI